MIGRIIVFVFFLQLFAFTKADGKKPVEKVINEIIRLTYNLQFDDAMKLTDSCGLKDTASLQWKYFKGVILLRRSKYMAYEISIGYKKDQSVIQSLIDNAVSEFMEAAYIGEELVKKNPKDSLALFYTGAAYGYIGMYYAGRRENFKAASVGKKGIEYHDSLIQQYPHCGDVYLSKAIFNYYASDVPWYLKPILWILGKSGSESDAIEYFQMVINNGTLAVFEAQEMLSQLYIRRGNGTGAIRIITKLIDQFPESKYYYALKYGKQLAEEKLFEQSNNLYQGAIEYSKRGSLTDLNKLEVAYIYLFLADNYNKLKNFIKVVKLWDELVDRCIAPEFESWAYVAMGNAFFDMEDKEEAKKCYDWVLANSKIENHKKIARKKLAEF
ncbi:MAG: tetratricopeptide repeat protein [Melioribacteraceae bacterium]|nr:tetratricopeptide repeat protein [Melioribacteraceae bacterium]